MLTLRVLYVEKRMKEKYRIMFAHYTLSVGGAEMSIINIANSLNRELFDVYVVCAEQGALDDKLRSDVKFTCLNLGHMSLEFLEYCRIIRKNKIDLVYTRLFNLTASIAAKICGIPVVHHVAGTLSTRRKIIRFGAKFRPFGHYLFPPLTDVYVAMSERFVFDLRKNWHIPARKIKLIFHGADTNKFNPNVNCNKLRKEFNVTDQKVIGVVARLYPVKRIDIALRAFAELKRITDQKVLLFVVGDGPYRKKYESLSRALKIDSETIFTGISYDIPQFMNLFDIYLQTTESALLGTTVVEAMACGKPIVIVASNEVEEQNAQDAIRDNGFIVSDEPRAIAESLCKLLNNKGLSDQMGRNSRKLAEEKFNFEKYVKQLEELSISLINRKCS